MPPVLVQYGFAGGEVSDHMRPRSDINRYFLSLEVCENFVTIPTGGIRSRYGTELVSVLPSSVIGGKLEPFEFSVEQSYMLAFSDRNVRVFQDRSGPLLANGQPLDVTTPYRAADIPTVQMTQSADVQFHAHPAYPPARLARVDATTFIYQPITFKPPPFFEADTFLNADATLSATTGQAITVTASGSVFMPSDVDRQLVSGIGRAVLTGFTSTTEMAATVIEAFSETVLASGTWALTGSPVANLRVEKAGPIGAKTTVSLQKDREEAPNLIPDGDFTGGQGGWTNHSGQLFASGTADTGSDDTKLVDQSATFISAGVQPNHFALNLAVAPVERKVVTAVLSESEINLAAPGASFSPGNAYEVRDTAVATFVNGEARLTGGANGVAWIERDVPTIPGRAYQVQRDVREGLLSMQVGSSSRGSELFAEATEDRLDNAIKSTFVATTTTSYVQFRNNQNTDGVVDNVEVREVSVDGFRSNMAGNIIFARNGTIELTEIKNARQAEGIIWAPLDEAEDTPIKDVPIVAGAWILGVPAWSATRGYPRAISFQSGGRLGYFATRQQPLTTWLSVVGLFDNFALGTDDSAAIEAEISSNQMDTIEWAEPFQDLLLGSRGGEHTLRGGTFNRLTPTNTVQVPQDAEGSAPLRPVRSGNRLFHVVRGRRIVRELRIDQETNLLAEPVEITLLADHISRSGIVQIALQRKPERILWAVRSDGVLIGYSFELAEEVRGWHRHITQGNVISVAIKQVDEDGEGEETEEVWLWVERNGNQCIEVMRPYDIQDGTRRAPLTLDSAVRQTVSSPTNTFSGLSHLDGQTVTVVGRETTTIQTRRDGPQIVDRLVNWGTALVANGTITLAETVTSERVDIGLPFVARAIPLPPELETREGSIRTRKGRWIDVAVEVFETIGLTVDGVRITERLGEDLLDTNIEPRSGILRGHGEGWDEAPQVIFEQREPFPATILAFTGLLEVEEVE